MQLPYITNELPGIGGFIRRHDEDFQVREIPLYEPCGQGTHVYFTVTKEGLATPAAIERIARFMGVRPADIGVAGLKDAQAITEQTMSLEHADEGKLARFSDSQIRISNISRHTNKLRTGHLSGNRFLVRIRGAGADQLPQAWRIVEVLIARGVPNFFGTQRFGARGDTARLGEALVLNDLELFVQLLLGRSCPDDPPDCKAARDAFDAGFYQRALDCWPRHYRDQRRALAAYRKKRRPVQALLAVDKRMRRFYVSAFQSELFNEVLSRRLGQLDKVFKGDLAQKIDTGGVFRVEDPLVDQPRADRFEISPTGPIVGYRASLAEGWPGQIEQEVIAGHRLELEKLRHLGPLKLPGSRRALRFALTNPSLSAGQDRHGEFIRLEFSAPAGAYATVVLNEIIKTDTSTTSHDNEKEYDQLEPP